MNAIHVIRPYDYNGMVVFDDKQVGLQREPFVADADTLIRMMVKEQHLDINTGCSLVFSDNAFPHYQYEFSKVFDDIMDNEFIETSAWYYNEKFNMKGWLCPALLKYFETPPLHLYVQIRE